ncbi:6-phosphofructokinase [Sarracenia purpurea var. burkii]
MLFSIIFLKFPFHDIHYNSPTKKECIVPSLAGIPVDLSFYAALQNHKLIIDKLNAPFFVQLVIEKQNKVVITDRMWARVLSSTNQPSFLSPRDVMEAKKEDPSQSQHLDRDSAALRQG